MHWSKSYHLDYTKCPRRFFYSTITAPRNPLIRKLEERQSPPLIRHDLVRRVIREIVGADDWTAEQLDKTIARARHTLEKLIPDPLAVNAEFSIVETCLQNFAHQTLPSIRNNSVVYISDGEPVEFVYNQLSILALPELVLDEGGQVNVLAWKTGSPNFRAEEEFRLRAGGLTCWSRSVLGCVDRPTQVSEIFLRERGIAYTVTLSDEQVRRFVDDAKAMVALYSLSAKIRDFPARPDLQTCRFCPFQTICPEWQEYAEVDYELETLSAELARSSKVQEEALAEVGGELRCVFLSHASEDKEEIVRPFARHLEAKGIPFWLDEAELRWGDSLYRSINRGLATSDYVICFITDAFLDRGWPQAELGAAAAVELADTRKQVLPIMVASPEMVFKEYPILRDKIFKRWDDGLENIVEELQAILAED